MVARGFLVFSLATSLCTISQLTHAASVQSRSIRQLDRRYVATSRWDPVFNAPAGSAGQQFEMSVDNGASWQAGARAMPFGLRATVGYRETHNPDSAFIAKDDVPNAASSPLSFERADPPYNFAILDLDPFIFADFSKSPAQPVTPGEWTPIPMSADLWLTNDGHCDVGSYNATFSYKDGTPPLVLWADSDQAIHYYIADLWAVSNITLSFGPVMYIQDRASLLANYSSAEHAPLVTAFTYMWGDFCDVDD